MKVIKLKNDILIGKDGLGEILWEGNFRIGETKTIPNLSKYSILEFYYSRGRDYGGSYAKAEYYSAHTSATIVYTGGSSGTYWNKRTANIYWTGNDVEFRNILEENASGSSVSTATNTNDNLYMIVGYN
jgi:hypothetical protein|nr:MAG TPA: hypothetical protein [Caudoviricetes sp.]